MPLLSRLMIRSAFLCLLVGFTLGGLILSAKGGVVDLRVWAWLPVHIILLVNGWMLQLSLGVAYWIMPRIHLAERGRRGYAWTGFSFFTSGNLLLIVSLLRIWWADAAQLTAPSIMLQMIGVGFMVFHLAPRIRPAMIRANQSEKPDKVLVHGRTQGVRKNDRSSKPNVPMEDVLVTGALTALVIFVVVFGLSLLEKSLSDQEIAASTIQVSIPSDADDVQENASSDEDSIVEETQPAPMRVTIVGSEFHFEPNELEFRVGVPVELTFENRGTTEHDLVIKDIPIADSDESDIRLYAWFGDSASITFTPTVAGEYDIICSILGHKEAGMTGRVVVRE